MSRLSRRYSTALATEGYEPTRRYEIGEGLAVLERFPKAKFDETVELAVRLGVDPKRTDQTVRGSVSLPHGLGKTRSVVVFAEGDAARDAEAAGADIVGGEDLAQRIVGGWTDFDVCVAHPSMMRIVGRLGRVLGPQGKMPSPKAGTVTDKVGEAVKEFKAGKVEFRAAGGGMVQLAVGKRSFQVDHLRDNVLHVIDHLRSLKPSSTKGAFIRKVCVSGTMTPSVTLDLE